MPVSSTAWHFKSIEIYYVLQKINQSRLHTIATYLLNSKTL